MTRAVLFDAPGPPGPPGKQGVPGAKGISAFDSDSNVLQFGADASGFVDSTAAFQAALNSGQVTIPPGTFLITSGLTVTSGTRIVGSGKNTILMFRGTGKLFTLAPPGSGQYGDCSFENFHVQNSAGYFPTHAIYIDNAYHVNVSRVRIGSDAGGGWTVAGIEVHGDDTFGAENSAAINIEQSEIYGCAGSGVLVSGTQPGPINIGPNCDIHLNGASGVYVSVTAFAKVNVQDCVIEANTAGQVVGNFGHGSMISGNYFEDPFDGVSMLRLLTFQGVCVLNNTFTRGSAAAPSYYIDLTGSSDGVVIQGNWFSTAAIALVNWIVGDNVIWGANRNNGGSLEFATGVSSTGLLYQSPKGIGRNSLQGMGGDRFTNTSASLVMATCFETQNVLDVEAGVYKITSTVEIPGTAVLIKGQGKGQSVFQSGTASVMFDIQGRAGQELIFEDITFDCNFMSWIFEGGAYSNVSFRRCSFINILGYGLNSSSSAFGKWVFEDCDFDGGGKMVGTAVSFNGSPSSLRFTRCTFRSLYQGIILVATGSAGPSTQNISLDGCEFDMMYYTCPVLSGAYTNSGTTTTYSSTALTDSSVSWPALASPGTPAAFARYGIIRALHVASSGTCTAIASQVVDASATFLSSGLIEGDIVRSGTAQTLVVSVESDTVLNVEEWRNTATMQIVTPPGGAYVAYHVLNGKMNTVSGHIISLYGYWQDLAGTQTTPSNGDLYEILPVVNYPVEGQSAVRRLKVTGCTFARSYTDQISPFGDENEISGNIIHHGQDVGITCNFLKDGRSNIHDNLIYNQGSSGIFWGGPNGHIHHNRIYIWGTRDDGVSNSTDGAAAIYCNPAGTTTASYNMLDHNICDGTSGPQSQHGIVAFNQISSQFLDNEILGLNGSGHAYTIQGSDTANILIRHTSDDIVFVDKGSGGQAPNQVIDVYGSSSPSARLAAGIGSRFVDSTNGHFYFNASGTSTWSTIV